MKVKPKTKKTLDIIAYILGGFAILLTLGAILKIAFIDSPKQDAIEKDCLEQGYEFLRTVVVKGDYRYLCCKIINNKIMCEEYGE